VDDCARFHLIASLQLDGEISLHEAEQLRAHAAACPSCRAYETGLRGLVAELRGSPPVQPEPDSPVNGFGREM
jgi:anti-sigma factor RsiW